MYGCADKSVAIDQNAGNTQYPAYFPVQIAESAERDQIESGDGCGHSW